MRYRRMYKVAVATFTHFMQTYKKNVCDETGPCKTKISELRDHDPLSLLAYAAEAIEYGLSLAQERLMDTNSDPDPAPPVPLWERFKGRFLGHTTTANSEEEAEGAEEEKETPIPSKEDTAPDNQPTWLKRMFGGGGSSTNDEKVVTNPERLITADNNDNIITDNTEEAPTTRGSMEQTTEVEAAESSAVHNAYNDVFTFKNLARLAGAGAALTMLWQGQRGDVGMQGLGPPKLKEQRTENHTTTTPRYRPY